jgi:hypothetical protein
LWPETPTPQLQLPLSPYRHRRIPLSDIAKAQREAYYEEIDSIPAAFRRLTSEVGAVQWYVVHPVTSYQVRGWSNKVLQDLVEWMQGKCPNEVFPRKARQVMEFKSARDEGLEEITKELAREAKHGEVGVEEGYTGDYEVVGSEEEVDEGQTGGGDGATTGKGKGRKVSGHAQAALDKAAAADKKAAKEAKIMDGWQVEH